MFSHAPEGYRCPFCRLAQGEDVGGHGSTQDDVVYRDADVTAFIASHWWPNNRGHILIIPNQHYENIYELPPELGSAIQATAQKITLAFKSTYRCDGVSTRQHNEPAGNQDVWHYHLHVFPRYTRDRLNLTRRRRTTPEMRAPYAARLRAFLDEKDPMP